MSKLSKILLGCTTSTALLVGSVAAAAEVGAAGTARSLQADTITVSLEAMNGTDAYGVAQLQEADEGQTALGLEVSGLVGDEPVVAMIVSGTCEEPGEIRAALGVIESDQEGSARGDFALDDRIENVLAVPSTIRLQPQGADAELLLCGQIASPHVEHLPDVEPAQTPIPDPIPAEGDEEVEEETVEPDFEDVIEETTDTAEETDVEPADEY